MKFDAEFHNWGTTIEIFVYVGGHLSVSQVLTSANEQVHTGEGRPNVLMSANLGLCRSKSTP